MRSPSSTSETAARSAPRPTTISPTSSACAEGESIHFGTLRSRPSGPRTVTLSFCTVSAGTDVPEYGWNG